MNLRTDFINEISHLNGKKVKVRIIQITPQNYPLGPFSFQFIEGENQIRRIENADGEYNGRNGEVSLKTTMELIKVEGGYYLILLLDGFDCNCIEIFRPDPPMEIGGVDVSLWWSYHPLRQFEIDKLTILKQNVSQSTSIKEGDCHPIRNIVVNGVKHCLL